MKCPFCLAKEPKYFMDGICRRCIFLRAQGVQEEDFPFSDDAQYSLNFELTPYQKEIAEKIVAIIQTQHIFLEAVCGAGKTEMCYELLKTCIQNKKRIGWAIPRRQVVLELAKRIQTNFKSCKVVPVCQGYIDDLWGDVVICTTHQLYRYQHYFDVLIVDEPDAFPFSNNDLLFDLMMQSVKGKILFMSATKNQVLLDKMPDVYSMLMPFRPNLKPLPIPVLRKNYLMLIKDLISLRKEKVLFFVPTIQLAKRYALLFNIPYITSKSENKENIIQTFLDHDHAKLISTTILERGVTFVDCFVFVLHAEHSVFDQGSLTQISGRVLRGASTKGACYFYSTKYCEEINQCIESLNKINQHAASVLNPNP